MEGKGSKIVSKGWTEQELIYVQDLRNILDTFIKIKSHPLTPGHVGQLWCVDGKPYAVEAIMNHLERRAILFKGLTKPPKEEKENGKKD